LAFLVTGALIAPIVAHIVLHLELTMRGDELPPVAEDRGGAQPFQRYVRESRHPARLAPR
jgi:hypothetical protein